MFPCHRHNYWEQCYIHTHYFNMSTINNEILWTLPSVRIIMMNKSTVFHAKLHNNRQNCNWWVPFPLFDAATFEIVIMIKKIVMVFRWIEIHDFYLDRYYLLIWTGTVKLIYYLGYLTSFQVHSYYHTFLYI